MEDHAHPCVEEASACGHRRGLVKITSPVSLPKWPDFPLSILPFDSGIILVHKRDMEILIM